jgi:hypothetical protein
LTGLHGDLPIGAMAAFGVLRICSRNERFTGAKLCWSGNGGDYRATLVTENDVSTDELVIALLSDVQKDRHWPDWEQVKNLTPDEFRAEAHPAAWASSPDHRERADWLACFGSELAWGRDGKLESTPFDMSVARQKFLADARRLAASLGSSDEYKEALFGPWKYRDDQHSLGWDPSTIKLGAFTHKAPTGMANTGVRAAVWLAFESLPLFPCFFARYLRTRGFDYDKRDATLVWPVWRPPMNVREVATLLGWPALYTDEPQADREEMRGRGVAAVYRSKRFKPNKYMVTFGPPELAYSE